MEHSSTVTSVVNETAMRLITRRKELVKELCEIDAYLRMAKQFGFKEPIETEQPTSPSPAPSSQEKTGKGRIIVSTEKLAKSIKVNYNDKSWTVISLRALSKIMESVRKRDPNKEFYTTEIDVDLSHATIALALKLMEFKGIIKRQGRHLTFIENKAQIPTPSKSIPVIDVESAEAQTQSKTLIQSPEEKARQIQQIRQASK